MFLRVKMRKDWQGGGREKWLVDVKVMLLLRHWREQDRGWAASFRNFSLPTFILGPGRLSGLRFGLLANERRR